MSIYINKGQLGKNENEIIDRIHKEIYKDMATPAVDNYDSVISSKHQKEAVQRIGKVYLSHHNCGVNVIGEGWMSIYIIIRSDNLAYGPILGKKIAVKHYGKDWEIDKGLDLYRNTFSINYAVNDDTQIHFVGNIKMAARMG